MITDNGQLPLPSTRDISPVTGQLVDEEVRHLIEAAHEEVTQLMSANRGNGSSTARVRAAEWALFIGRRARRLTPRAINLGCAR